MLSGRLPPKLFYQSKALQLAGQIAAIAAHTVNFVPHGFTAESPIPNTPPKRRGHLRESYKTKL